MSREVSDDVLAALIEVAACANYYFVAAPGNPFHGPKARKKLEAAILRLWTTIGADENTPFSRDPYESAMAIMAERIVAPLVSRDGDHCAHGNEQCAICDE